MSEKLKRYDTFGAGLLSGVGGALIAFFLIAWISLLRFPDWTFSHFFFRVFLGTRDYIAPILSFCLILDVPLFFLAIRWKMDRFAKGVLSLFFLMLPFIIYFRFF